MNIIGLRFNDNGVRGSTYAYLIVRDKVDGGYYKVEWFDHAGHHTEFSDRWMYEDLIGSSGGVKLDEVWEVSQLLKQYDV
jgi:hypothetical protein